MKKIAFFLAAMFILFTLVGCGTNDSKEGNNTNSSETIVGKWYNSNNRCLDIRSDGTYKLENAYGTGKWKILDDKKTFEFTDFYGDTQESEINKDESGKYIDFGYYGKFYKGSAPSNEEDSFQDESLSGTTSDDKKNSIQIDPFEGLKFEVSGISPYCQISLNNQNCSYEAQNNVTYELDKDRYANGETVVITAVLSPYAIGDYSLSDTTSEFKVDNQPEYIQSVENLDLTQLKKELNDKILSEKSSLSNDNGYLFGADVSGIDEATNFGSCDKVTEEEVYFSALKLIRLSDFELDAVPYNCLSFVYEVDFTWEGHWAFQDVLVGNGTMWVNISANNIVKYPDGSVKWGSSSTDDYDFSFSHSKKGLEDCISSTIINRSDNYNISKVSLQG